MKLVQKYILLREQYFFQHIENVDSTYNFGILKVNGERTLEQIKMTLLENKIIGEKIDTNELGMEIKSEVSIEKVFDNKYNFAKYISKKLNRLYQNKENINDRELIEIKNLLQIQELMLSRTSLDKYNSQLTAKKLK